MWTVNSPRRSSVPSKHAELERLAARPSIEAWLRQVRTRKRAAQTHVSSKQILENKYADRR
jgi:hypothetical protein